jgi:hypothetical protein
MNWNTDSFELASNEVKWFFEHKFGIILLERLYHGVTPLVRFIEPNHGVTILIDSKGAIQKVVILS